MSSNALLSHTTPQELGLVAPSEGAADDVNQNASSTLPPKKLQKIIELFKSVDADGSGELDASELQSVLERCGFTGPDLPSHAQALCSSSH